MNEMPPIFFPSNFWSLKTSQQKFLFAKAEEVFQITPLSIGLMNIFQFQFMPSFSNDQEP